ncbi:similar to Saccharomyces cerevisiae YDR213W UPC2 Sterol regulatory element binding protein [Geotrichum candidum]|uniref:Similar to Saccharomyces cerevisiae YDR213W UPC2 Sterol regulatory element binding protein n=1 Tax=Geotrichum candidum TaxID=1173061 RepID=A0A0J9XDV6_GEOCN|nr:similar to Saccharomyces cerevisiae YDR213W UPC2 Sterol regulatory element binding protein [Geotrichum candidum]
MASESDIKPSVSSDASPPSKSNNNASTSIGKPKSSKRRPHSKSRHGCTTCKRRRVKCDETHPICKNCQHLGLECSFTGQAATGGSPATGAGFTGQPGALNIMDIRLFHHYTTVVGKTIVTAGISNEKIWCHDVPELAFDYPFLMHSILSFSATHLSRTCKPAIDQVVMFHRMQSLKLLSEAVKAVSVKNLDALVASTILLILDSLANASTDSSRPSALPPSAWLHHVRGAATILTAIGQPSEESRFYKLVNTDLSDLASGLMTTIPGVDALSSLECFEDDLQDLYPVSISSPYYHALAYLDKLFKQRYKSDFILRVFSFPALLDMNLVAMLIKGDDWAKRIVRVYYKLVRSFTSEMKEKVWFLEGVGKVLPIDSDSEYGGLAFITRALPLKLPQLENLVQNTHNSNINNNNTPNNISSKYSNASLSSSLASTPASMPGLGALDAFPKQPTGLDSFATGGFDPSILENLDFETLVSLLSASDGQGGLGSMNQAGDAVSSLLGGFGGLSGFGSGSGTGGVAGMNSSFTAINNTLNSLNTGSNVGSSHRDGGANSANADSHRGSTDSTGMAGLDSDVVMTNDVLDSTVKKESWSSSNEE